MSIRTEHPLAIGLLWHSIDSDNLGQGALTAGHLEIIDRAARKAGVACAFTVLGAPGARTPYLDRDDVRARPLRLAGFARRRSGANCFGGLDIVLDIGAGDGFSDIYGAPQIARTLLAQTLVLRAAAKLIISPQSIGPFRSGFLRRAALKTLERAALVAVRDDASAEFVRTAGFEGPIVEASDVGLAMGYARSALPQGNKIRVGVNISGALLAGGGAAHRCDYEALVSRMLQWLEARGDVETHLIAQVISDGAAGPCDYAAAQAFRARFPGAVLAPRFASPMEAKGYIAAMDFFAGARMHGAIAALSTETPAFVVAYSRKFEALFGSLGYGALADCRYETAEQIFDAFRDAFENRRFVKVAAAKALKRGLARLAVYESALGAILSETRAVKASRGLKKGTMRLSAS